MLLSISSVLALYVVITSAAPTNGGCYYDGKQHSDGEQWITNSHIMLKCTSGSVVGFGCVEPSNLQTFPLGTDGVEILGYKYYCRGSPSGPYSYYRTPVTSSDLGIGRIVVNPDGTKTFVAESPIAAQPINQPQTPPTTPTTAATTTTQGTTPTTEGPYCTDEFGLHHPVGDQWATTSYIKMRCDASGQASAIGCETTDHQFIAAGGSLAGTVPQSTGPIPVTFHCGKCSTGYQFFFVPDSYLKNTPGRYELSSSCQIQFIPA